MSSPGHLFGKNTMELRYHQPARKWEESLPIGNGSLGAMIWGGISREILGLNEESLWSGYPRNKNNLQAFKNLEYVRKLIFSGKNKEAEEVIRKNMLGEYCESYMPLGNLEFSFEGIEEKAEEYQRILDLEHAVAVIKYCQNGVYVQREYFASYPAKAVIIRFQADEKVLGFEMGFASQLVCQQKAEKTGIHIAGQCPEHVDPHYVPLRPENIIQGSKGKKFTADIRILACDGSISVSGNRLKVENAGECVIVFSVVRLPEVKENAVYDELKEEHIRDYRKLYSRVELYLGEQLELPTDERLERLKNGGEDNGLYSLYFQYGRYLLISSSREGSLPANLQGIWNWEIRPPWSSNWTVNINTEMNYWPALSCALLECLVPYVDFMKKICREGRKTAEVNYHCRGFTAHHNIDYWGNTNPVGIRFGEKEGEKESVSWSFWPMGGAWLSQELYRIWEYQKDEKFLREAAWPIIREAALFLNDWLVKQGEVWVTCPSTSPENSFLLPDGSRTSVAEASAMDMAIVREVFEHYEEFCGILSIEEELREEISEKLPDLKNFSIGSYGQLLEWDKEYEEWEPGHRHVSHLYGLFPGELFERDEKLKEACRISLEHRLEHGGGHTGWSCAWIQNLFAILGDGEKAYSYLHTLLTRSTYPNLWDQCPPFQIDGNFGGTAGIANMLVQDRGGTVKVLPALPKVFKSGYVKGLWLKDRKGIDIQWENAEVVSYRIYDR